MLMLFTRDHAEVSTAPRSETVLSGARFRNFNTNQQAGMRIVQAQFTTMQFDNRIDDGQSHTVPGLVMVDAIEAL